MSNKRVLFCVISTGILLVLVTWWLGHLWAFIMIVFTALGAIAWSRHEKDKSPDSDR